MMRSVRAAVVVWLSAALTLGQIGIGTASESTQLPDLPLAIGNSGDLGWYVRSGEALWHRDPDAWSVTDARAEPDGSLLFHVSVTTSNRGVVLEPGPAVLLVGLSLQGGLGGDVGYGRLVQRRAFDAGACVESPCTFEADVELDATRIQEAIEALPHVDANGVEVSLGLIRTYGQGEWLQELQLLVPEQRRLADRRDGTLTDPEGTSGEVLAYGIFPAADIVAARDGRNPAFDLASIVEASRTRQQDTSAETPMVRVELVLDAVDCRAWEPIAIVDDAGVQAFDRAIGAIDPVHEIIELPAGGSWRLGLRIPYPDSSRDGGVTAGSFTTSRSDLRVSATFDCREPSALAASGFEVEEIEALAQPSTVGRWSPVRGSWSGGRGARPYVVAAHRSGLLSLEATPGGWRLRRSRDGWRWQSRPIVTRGRELPDGSSVTHARLLPRDGALVLAMAVEGTSGRPRLETWTSRDGARWRAANANEPIRLPEPLDDFQLASSGEVVLALARGDHRHRLLSSADGRTWDTLETAGLSAIGSGTDRILGVLDRDGRTWVSASADGLAWEPLWEVPAGAVGPYRIIESEAGVLLVATGGAPGPIIWLRSEADRDWRAVASTRYDVRVDDVAADRSDVVVSGRVKGAGERGTGWAWTAASHDGGMRWRQALHEDASGRCRMRAAVSDGALITATADCDGQPTVWRAQASDDEEGEK